MKEKWGFWEWDRVAAATSAKGEGRGEGGGPRVRREWSTCLQLCGGTPRLLWCRYPEATQICVAPSAAPSAARAATGERRRDGGRARPGLHFRDALIFVTPTSHSLVHQLEIRGQKVSWHQNWNEPTDDLIKIHSGVLNWILGTSRFPVFHKDTNKFLNSTNVEIGFSIHTLINSRKADIQFMKLWILWCSRLVQTPCGQTQMSTKLINSNSVFLKIFQFWKTKQLLKKNTHKKKTKKQWLWIQKTAFFRYVAT